MVATPKTTPPPELIPSLMDRSREWQQRYADAGKFEAFGLFPSGGGFAIADVSDEAELHRMILEMPFSPFSDHQITAIVDPATGLRQSREVFAAMMASA